MSSGAGCSVAAGSVGRNSVGRADGVFLAEGRSEPAGFFEI